MSFLFINKTLWLNNFKTRATMIAKISVLVICVEVIIYLLLYHLQDYPFTARILYDTRVTQSLGLRLSPKAFPSL